jgi:hypothetical protein
MSRVHALYSFGAAASVLTMRGGLAIVALTSLVVAFLARSFR